MMAFANPALWTAAEVKAATGGKCGADFAARGVSIDSRTVAPGDLFVALAGPTFDGHDFIAQALAAGAAGVVASRRPATVATDAPIVLVDDTFAALNGLGRFARARSNARIAAVTGSVGKTGTKEALRHVLARQGRTAASAGSLNNHWGAPLSLARTARDTQFGVFELGMNHAGELGPLSRLVRPHVAIVTTVEAVHAEFFSGIEAIADAKAEIFEGLEPQGVAVLNRDNAMFERLASAARRHGASVVSFGRNAEADVRLLAADLGPTGSHLTIEFQGRRGECDIGIAGQHWAMNSLAVLSAVRALGGDMDAAMGALATLEPMAGRGRRHQIALAGGSFALIDESYNASPVSMQAAFAVLARVPVERGRRRIAVLGDMLELGPQGPVQHAALAAPLIEAGVDLVFTAGPLTGEIDRLLPQSMRGGHFENSRALADVLAGRVRPGDVVMVKGSAGSRMGVVVQALLALAEGGSGSGANADLSRRPRAMGEG